MSTDTDTAAPTEESLTAAGSLLPPPIGHFRNPKFSGPTPHTVHPPDENGWRKVEGHLALWKSSHVGMPGRNVRPPRSPSDYAHFHVATTEVLGDDGQPTTTSCGHLTCDTGHAGMEASASDATRFYDNTGTLAASVCAGEDAWGIWYSGVVEPELPELTLRRFSSCSQSGDWRSIAGGPLDLVASLSVVTPGFPIPRSRVASGAPANQPMSLVAAGALLPRDTNPKEIIVTVTPTETEEDAAMAKTDTTTKDTVEEPEAVEAPVTEEETTTEELESHPAGNLVSIRDGEFVGLVTDTDTHDPATVSVQIEVPRELVASATPEQRALVSSAVQQKMRDRELDARFSELAGRVTAAESAAEKAWSHARGVEAMSDLDGIV